MKPLVWFNLFLIITTGCSHKDHGEEYPKDSLIFQKAIRLNPSSHSQPDKFLYSPRALSVAYDNENKYVLFSRDPKGKNHPDIFAIKFDFQAPAKKLSDFKLAKYYLSNGSISQIEISPNDKFQAFTGKSRKLFIQKLLESPLVIKLSHEATVLKFDESEKLLAVGTKAGNLLLVDLLKLQVIFNKHIFPGEITSLVFADDQRILLVGESSKILEFNVNSKEIRTIFETESGFEKFSKKFGLKSCLQSRVNNILYVASRNIAVTSHGWDYCSGNKIKVWDVKNGKLLKEISEFRYPVMQMTLSPQKNDLLLFDSDQNIFRLNLNHLSLLSVSNLNRSFVRFSDLNLKNAIDYQSLGRINKVLHISNSDLYFLAVGSFHKLGGGVVLLEVSANRIRHLAHLVLDNHYHFSMFLSKKVL